MSDISKESHTKGDSKKHSNSLNRLFDKSISSKMTLEQLDDFQSHMQEALMSVSCEMHKANSSHFLRVEPYKTGDIFSAVIEFDVRDHKEYLLIGIMDTAYTVKYKKSGKDRCDKQFTKEFESKDSTSFADAAQKVLKYCLYLRGCWCDTCRTKDDFWDTTE
jgi:hypothetical protein